jgi:hypothetical protein
LTYSHDPTWLRVNILTDVTRQDEYDLEGGACNRRRIKIKIPYEKNIYPVRFEVSTAVTMMIIIFWEMIITIYILFYLLLSCPLMVR